MTNRSLAAIVELTDSEPLEHCQVSAFRTPLGWFGLLGSEDRLLGVRMGHASRDDVRQAFIANFDLTANCVQAIDWSPAIRAKLEAFAAGEPVSFEDVEITYRRTLPPFRRKVIVATRRIAYGQTLSYQELAGIAGSPRAARAVGNSMATNVFPIIVPCHRVLGSGGHLGGFTAPGGLTLKERLLALEAADSAEEP